MAGAATDLRVYTSRPVRRVGTARALDSPVVTLPIESLAGRRRISRVPLTGDRRPTLTDDPRRHVEASKGLGRVALGAVASVCLEAA